jgi:hypothetical protein
MGDLMMRNDVESLNVEDAPFPLTDTDRWVLSQTDEEFHLHGWHELREIIGEEAFICLGLHCPMTCLLRIEVILS